MAKKKDFKDAVSPAEYFISIPEEVPAEEQAQTPSHAPEGYKVNYLFVETRSKRVQLLVQPSLLKKLKAKAKREGRSLNDLVHSVLEDAVKGE